MNKFFIATLFLISCIPNKEVIFNQENTIQKITISCNIQGEYKDSVRLNIPIEIRVSNLNETTFLEFDFKYDNNILIYPTNYIIYNDDFKTKYLRPLKPKKDNYNQIKLLLVNRKINISNLKAKNILEKYNYSKELGNIFKDTIQLTTYQQFKKDFPEVFNELNTDGDSLIITTREGDSKTYHSKAYPIKW